jgi:heme a synthase
MPEQALVDWTPALRLAVLALALALPLLLWVGLRNRGAPLPQRLATLTALTLFLTFDLIVFGAFTRLSDSGLGCPDWPGCYGELSPWGAKADIQAAQALAPAGPVTWGKAWIEMIHRYLAMTVGVLILVMAVVGWKAWLAKPSALPFSPLWPTLTLVWVLVQGAFGKYTVTLKLYPAIVSLHLVGGMVLLVLLARQHAVFTAAAATSNAPSALTPPLWRLALLAAAALAVQVVLGAWVSTNYAVLACTGFPQCNGQWWPGMNFDQGFTVLRHLGEGGTVGGKATGLQVQSLVAIHMVHRLGAVVVTVVLGTLAVCLWRAPAGGQHSAAGGSQRRTAAVLAGLLLVQLLSGLSNVVLGWPLVAALGHSAGAAGLVLALALLLSRPRHGLYRGTERGTEHGIARGSAQAHRLKSQAP